MASSFLSESDQQRVIEAIKKAEQDTSGEIRVHIEPICTGDPVERATVLFEKLGMTATAQRNGVLFYVAYKDKKLAVLGDKGIDEKVTHDFWDEEKNLMTQYFKDEKYAEGLCLVIARAGEKLRTHFPFSKGDSDELSNDISFEGGEDA